MSARSRRPSRIRPSVLATAMAAVAMLAACAGDDTGGSQTEANAANTPPAAAGAPGMDTAGTAGAGAGTGGAVASDTIITPELIAQGEAVFRGEGGAICTTCHGADASGIAGLGPSLRDGEWLHGDGSYEFIQNIIRTGVMQPVESPSVMPPYGGVPFSDQRLRAVAAYIHSLNQA